MKKTLFFHLLSFIFFVLLQKNRQKMKKILLLACCSLLLLWSCGETPVEKRRLTKAERERLKAEERQALKFGVLPTLDCLPLFVAKERGVFEKLGVDVRLRPCKAQMDIDTALVGGSMNGAVSDSVRVARMISRGTPLKSLGRSIADWQLIANRSARLKEVKQLGDKMVAMTRYSATDYLTDHVLKGVKTQATVYRVQINDVSLRLQMLLNNEMDALWLPEPQATVAREHGNTVLWDTRKAGMKLGRMVVREKDIADKRVREQVEKLVKGYNMACDSLNAKGLLAYGEVIVKYCHVEEKSIGALPKVRFEKLK